MVPSLPPLRYVQPVFRQTTSGRNQHFIWSTRFWDNWGDGPRKELTEGQRLAYEHAATVLKPAFDALRERNVEAEICGYFPESRTTRVLAHAPNTNCPSMDIKGPINPQTALANMVSLLALGIRAMGMQVDQACSLLQSLAGQKLAVSAHSRSTK